MQMIPKIQVRLVRESVSFSLLLGAFVSKIRIVIVFRMTRLRGRRPKNLKSNSLVNIFLASEMSLTLPRENVTFARSSNGPTTFPASSLTVAHSLTTGYVSYYETKWLAHEYNRSWRLDINEADIDAAIKWSLEGEKVNIDAFLKRLVNMEPN